MFLLRTERPVLLARELPTHQWYLEHDPCGEFGLELVYDNAPGGWQRYREAFAVTWERARAAHTGMIVSESDVVPTMEAFQSVLGCPQAICMVPYLNVMLGAEPRYGIVIQERVKGGWASRLGRPGDEWVVDGDLGFVKFGPAVCQRGFPPDLLFDRPDLLINTAVFDWLRPAASKRTGAGHIHVHWPALVNSHDTWDAGDDAHHPPERIPEMHRVHARWLDPSLK